MMKNSTHIRLAGPVILASLLFTGCVPEPTPSFTADQTTIDEGGQVQFTDQSTNHPSAWLWSFAGGNPSSSRDQNPAVTYAKAGQYAVSLEVRNRGGANLITRNNYITVLAPTTNLTFRNKTYTDIQITLGGVAKTISSGGDVTYNDIEGESVSFYAETSGTTAQGDVLGVELYWSFDVDLNGGTTVQDLNVGTDYFFLYITNKGTHVLSPLQIDDGSAEFFTEEVSVPADEVKYQIGYYHAWDQTQVRAYYEDDPENYTYWNHNEHFFFPNTMNQNVSLSNQFKKAVAAEPGRHPGNIQSGDLLPAGDDTPPAVPREGDVQYFASEK